MRVLARSESLFAGGRDELTFRGVGQMEKTEYGHRLRYTAQNEADGSGVASEIRLETSLHRAVVITESRDGGSGLLLDPRAETVTPIAGGCRPRRWAGICRGKGRGRSHYGIHCFWGRSRCPRCTWS